eukprot:364835-Chlamydomonas_euryale.AAC.6
MGPGPRRLATAHSQRAYLGNPPPTYPSIHPCSFTPKWTRREQLPKTHKRAAGSSASSPAGPANKVTATTPLPRPRARSAIASGSSCNSGSDARRIAAALASLTAASSVRGGRKEWGEGDNVSARGAHSQGGGPPRPAGGTPAGGHTGAGEGKRVFGREEGVREGERVFGKEEGVREGKRAFGRERGCLGGEEG